MLPLPLHPLHVYSPLLVVLLLPQPSPLTLTPPGVLFNSLGSYPTRETSLHPGRLGACEAKEATGHRLRPRLRRSREDP